MCGLYVHFHVNTKLSWLEQIFLRCWKQTVWPVTLVLFFKIILDIVLYLYFFLSFRICLSISITKTTGILNMTAENFRKI